MKQERIIHFKVHHHGVSRLARGLLFLECNQEPMIEDYEQCLKACGHDVHIENADQFLFIAHKPNEDYQIEIIPNYEQVNRDMQTESLAKSFLK
ncbi:hypothetical protein SAMN03159341_12164 [Paenibacillus sp. 1_12]|uniref:hypothetical protein n=1 Tax=Paenibacillus sp. 1_12 TaxID=1566278 RepID=UPI0008EDDB36|nr:hypothetical protein [Paenibacillus sp. 1_12]SFM23084.1 hypothetical protein SAMN03159341_12164 [Paenibacillus sp. 1_12]